MTFIPILGGQEDLSIIGVKDVLFSVESRMLVCAMMINVSKSEGMLRRTWSIWNQGRCRYGRQHSRLDVGTRNRWRYGEEGQEQLASDAARRGAPRSSPIPPQDHVLLWCLNTESGQENNVKKSLALPQTRKLECKGEEKTVNPRRGCTQHGALDHAL
jgi:hypothetical protein